MRTLCRQFFNSMVSSTQIIRSISDLVVSHTFQEPDMLKGLLALRQARQIQQIFFNKYWFLSTKVSTVLRSSRWLYKLTSLTIHDSAVVPHALGLLQGQLPRLEHLDLEGCSKIPFEELAVFFRTTNRLKSFQSFFLCAFRTFINTLCFFYTI